MPHKYNDDPTDGFLTKLKISLYFGFIGGLLAGLTRAAYFILSEKYTSFELERAGLYLLHHPIIESLYFGLLASLVFAVVWYKFKNVEGFVVSGLLVLLVFLPIAKYLNENYLPGIREIKSIIGNFALMLVALAAFIFLYLKGLKNLRLLRKLYSRLVFIFFIFVLGVLSIAYYAQPGVSRLTKSPKSFSADFINLFNVDSLKTLTDTLASDELSIDILLKGFATKHDSVKQELLNKIKLYYDEPNDAVGEAEKIINREFTLWGDTRTLPDTIDWYDNVTGDAVWLYALDEFEWMMHIMYAYILTNDEKYAVEFQKIMTDFFDQVNLIDWKNEEDPVWRLIGVGLRLSDSWVDALYLFSKSPSVSRDLLIKMLGYIHDQAQFLCYFRSPRRNHLIQESYGLLKAGIMFPEFKASQRWLNMALYRLDKAVTMDVYPDGGYNEGSTFYHRYVIRLFQMIMDYAELHGVRLSDNFYDKFEKMYHFLMYTTWPDGRMAAANDGFHAIEQQNLFDKPAKRFNRPDFKFFATNGQEGTEPDTTSTAFPYTGFYVMRSDWTKDARYCILDAGLFGSAHGHEDKLNFEIFAYGQPFIVESGTFTYVYNKWHKYFESSFSHNTVTVDGRSQLRTTCPDEWISEPHTEQPNVWISNENFDYVESKYDKGYRNYKEQTPVEITHTRRILFIKPDYWILWDVLSGQGNHKFDQQFHFYPMPLEITDSTKTVVTQNTESANLLLSPLSSRGLSVEVIEGAEDPIQGWYSPKYGEKQPAPTVIYTRENQTPAVFASVIFPLPRNMSAESVRISQLRVQTVDEILEDTEAIAIKVESIDWADYICISPGNTDNKRFDNIITSGEFCYKRMNKAGSTMREVESGL